MTVTGNRILDPVIFIILLIMSVILHEVSHGLVARRLGDGTAAAAGRLTLNPIPHIDPFGSVLLPAMLALSGAPVFGWARPVPVNPRAFSRPTEGMALTALAGPVSNLALALIAGRVILPATSGIVADLVWAFGIINVVLAVFNLLPIPPLDGSRMVPLLLGDRGRAAYAKVEPYGFLILFALLFIIPGATRWLSVPISTVSDWMGLR
ncbi:MAG: site-2 protease family protein [Acidimicrobiia bacterium]|nr:site-2 protease family protein [Acidimicrobiia bacterium]